MVFASSLHNVASVATISSSEISLGAIVKDNPRERTSSSSGESGLVLRFTTSLLWWGEYLDCGLWGIRVESLRTCLSFMDWWKRCSETLQSASKLDHLSALRDWESLDSSYTMCRKVGTLISMHLRFSPIAGRFLSATLQSVCCPHFGLLGVTDDVVEVRCFFPSHFHPPLHQSA